MDNKSTLDNCKKRTSSQSTRCRLRPRIFFRRHGFCTFRPCPATRSPVAAHASIVFLCYVRPPLLFCTQTQVTASPLSLQVHGQVVGERAAVARQIHHEDEVAILDHACDVRVCVAVTRQHLGGRDALDTLARHLDQSDAGKRSARTAHGAVVFDVEVVEGLRELARVELDGASPGLGRHPARLLVLDLHGLCEWVDGAIMARCTSEFGCGRPTACMYTGAYR